MNLEKTMDAESKAHLKTVDGQTLEGLVKPAYELIELMKTLCEMKQCSNNI